MKFEEVLPAFREGKAIQRETWNRGAIAFKDWRAILITKFNNRWATSPVSIDELPVLSLIAEDWEIVE